MQISDPNLHLKLQEMCDCYLETDFLPQLSRFGGQPGPDPDDEALRYLALALMRTITEQAGELSLKKEDGNVKVKVKQRERKEELPSPPIALFDRIVAAVRAILHIEGEKGESEMALGLQNGSVEMRVKLKEKDGKSSLKFEMVGN